MKYNIKKKNTKKVFEKKNESKLYQIYKFIIFLPEILIYVKLINLLLIFPIKKT